MTDSASRVGCLVEALGHEAETTRASSMARRRPGRACRNSDRETPEEERHHSCQLILVLSPVLEETIVAASIVVLRFYRLSLPTQGGLELSRHLHRCDRVPPVRRAIGGPWSISMGMLNSAAWFAG